MTDAILGQLGQRVAAWTLVPGRGGVFDVWAGDRLVFSKQHTGRYPTPEEILAALAQP
ncbi:MAG: Rdx family protein [Chloroflexi bacterium]|nr:Rdx family protein [Chloroflexota bacterium]